MSIRKIDAGLYVEVEEPEPRYYAFRQGRIHYVMDRTTGKAVTFYSHPELAANQAARLNGTES